MRQSEHLQKQYNTKISVREESNDASNKTGHMYETRKIKIENNGP